MSYLDSPDCITRFILYTANVFLLSNLPLSRWFAFLTWALYQILFQEVILCTSDVLLSYLPLGSRGLTNTVSYDLVFSAPQRCFAFQLTSRLECPDDVLLSWLGRPNNFWFQLSSNLFLYTGADVFLSNLPLDSSVQIIFFFLDSGVLPDSISHDLFSAPRTFCFLTYLLTRASYQMLFCISGCISTTVL